jgi:dihydropteroate synthase
MSQSVRATEALEVRGARLVWGERTYLMGIVNASPDSFSGDGLAETGAALERALAQRAAGADILDVGAESTRPGHQPISLEEELRRLVPVVRAVRAAAPTAIISVDTFKPDVFRAAHAAGGDVLNSIWGLDDALLAAAVECQAPVVIMHNGRLRAPLGLEASGGSVDGVLDFLSRQAARAVAAGIARERVILDPGIGFGKTPEENLAMLAALPRLAGLGFPTLVGTSRKSTLGLLTGRPVGERAFATAATVALAAAAGIDVVRVHDVAEMRDVARVADAISRGWRPAGWAGP